MHCPSCHSTALRILQSRRNAENTTSIIRQRVCQDCKHRWFTAEVPIPSYTVTQGSCGYFRSTALIHVHNAAA